MNKIVLNYIQEELGSEPKDFWSNTDEKKLDKWIDVEHLDKNIFPDLSYNQIKEIVFETMYQEAEKDVLSQVEELVEGVVPMYDDGGTTPKSKILSGDEMLSLLSKQVGDDRKKIKGFTVINDLVKNNPKTTFTVSSDGKIVINDPIDWEAGLGDGSQSEDKPSIFKRLFTAGENKAQSLYNAASEYIKKDKELFKPTSKEPLIKPLEEAITGKQPEEVKAGQTEFKPAEEPAKTDGNPAKDDKAAKPTDKKPVKPKTNPGKSKWNKFSGSLNQLEKEKLILLDEAAKKLSPEKKAEYEAMKLAALGKAKDGSEYNKMLQDYYTKLTTKLTDKIRSGTIYSYKHPDHPNFNSPMPKALDYNSQRTGTSDAKATTTKQPSTLSGGHAILSNLAPILKSMWAEISKPEVYITAEDQKKAKDKKEQGGTIKNKPELVKKPSRFSKLIK